LKTFHSGKPGSEKKRKWMRNWQTSNKYVLSKAVNLEKSAILEKSDCLATFEQYIKHRYQQTHLQMP
jgi:hypothetical protein